MNRPVAFSSISQPSLGTAPEFLGLPQCCLLFTEQSSSQNQPCFSNVAGQRGRGKITGIRGHLGSFRIELFSEQAINPVALKRAPGAPAPLCLRIGMGEASDSRLSSWSGPQWCHFPPLDSSTWGLSPHNYFEMEESMLQRLVV